MLFRAGRNGLRSQAHLFFRTRRARLKLIATRTSCGVARHANSRRRSFSFSAMLCIPCPGRSRQTSAPPPRSVAAQAPRAAQAGGGAGGVRGAADRGEVQPPREQPAPDRNGLRRRRAAHRLARQHRIRLAGSRHATHQLFRSESGIAQESRVGPDGAAGSGNRACAQFCGRSSRAWCPDPGCATSSRFAWRGLRCRSSKIARLVAGAPRLNQQHVTSTRGPQASHPSGAGQRALF